MFISNGLKLGIWGVLFAPHPQKKSGNCKYLNTRYTQLNKEITMARIKGGIKKKEEETAFEKAMKKLKQKQQNNTVMPGNTKGVISDKEYDFFLKLLSKKNK